MKIGDHQGFKERAIFTIIILELISFIISNFPLLIKHLNVLKPHIFDILLHKMVYFLFSL